MSRIPRLHLISSYRHCPLDRFPEVAAAAAAGGVDAVHIREPDLPEYELIELTRIVREALAGSSCLVLVNTSFVAVAAAGADGLHLPERGPSLDEARSMLPSEALVGRSVHSVDSAIQAERDGATYVMAGHVFETGSKPGQAGRGLGFVRDVASAIGIPVVAIGGITPGNTADVIEAGAYGVAVLSGILAADDPADAASRYLTAIESGRGERL